MVGGDNLSYLIFWAKLTPFVQNADFQLIFAGSASPVTPSEKIQLTRTGSLGFSMSLRLTRTLPLSPQRGQVQIGPFSSKI